MAGRSDRLVRYDAQSLPDSTGHFRGRRARSQHHDSRHGQHPSQGHHLDDRVLGVLIHILPPFPKSSDAGAAFPVRRAPP